jgi:isopentenyl-diphosphate delta-isomerase
MIGYSDALPQINKEEVEDYKYMDLDEVDQDIKNNPNLYTAWFKIIFERFYDHLKANQHEN